MDYIRNLASDLLNLEVNTIIKDNTTSGKMPAKKRIALLEIADMYREKLVQYGVCEYATREKSDTPNHKLIKWRFGGEFSFKEIKNFAEKEVSAIHEKIDEPNITEAKKKAFEGKLKILNRIVRQSSSMIGMFKIRRHTFKVSEESENSKGLFPSFYKGEEQEDYQPFLSQVKSAIWNNDISLADINSSDDIQLSPDQITLIRKAWEIGTQQVLLQTIIQLDGDVTSYLTHEFLRQPEDSKRMLLNLHNDAIGTSTAFWSTLFNTVSNLAGKAFSKIFSS